MRTNCGDVGFNIFDVVGMLSEALVAMREALGMEERKSRKRAEAVRVQVEAAIELEATRRVSQWPLLSAVRATPAGWSHASKEFPCRADRSRASGMTST